MLHAGYGTLASGHAPRVEDPFTLVVHDERQLLAACLAPDVITSLPSHSGACSNQNVLNPLGAYAGVQSCGCRREDPLVYGRVREPTNLKTPEMG